MKTNFKNHAFKKVKPVVVDISESIVSIEEYPTNNSLIIVKPSYQDVDLVEWMKDNLEFLQQKLETHGAILFRGFNIENEESFNHLIKATSEQLLDYMERTTPRTQTSKNIYTSTEFPADQTIAMHNELSYSVNSPKKLWFYCSTPSNVGGETPIADGRKVLSRLPEDVVRKFQDKGWMLERNFGNGFGLRWQEAFNTTDQNEVESYCDENEILYKWKSDDHLQTRQVRNAIRKHNSANELVWFNHIAFYHHSNLEKEMRDHLIKNFGKGSLPFNTFYGDGSSIENVTIEMINQAYESEKIIFKWEKQDILILDNYIMSHGRNPFEGLRKILVAMGN